MRCLALLLGFLVALAGPWIVRWWLYVRLFRGWAGPSLIVAPSVEFAPSWRGSSPVSLPGTFFFPLLLFHFSLRGPLSAFQIFLTFYSLTSKNPTVVTEGRIFCTTFLADWEAYLALPLWSSDARV